MAEAARRLEDGDYTETVLVPLSQLRPAPWNPRLIRDGAFRALCASLDDDPLFLWDNPILTNRSGVIYRGNMRYRAAEHLGWTVLPTRQSDLSDVEAKTRALRDNNHFGEWDEPALGELVLELQQADVALETLGFPDLQLDALLDSTGSLGDVLEATNGGPEDVPRTLTCPQCGHRWVDRAGDG